MYESGGTARTRSSLGMSMAGALLAFTGTQAQAVIVTDWNVAATAVWDSTQTVPAASYINDTLLEWGNGGNGAGPSSLAILPSVADQPTTGSLSTVGQGGVALGDPGTILNTFDLIHTNSPAPDNNPTSTPLESTVLLIGLTLTPTAPSPGAPFGPFNLNIPIVFEETLNTGTCPGGTLPPCADILAIGATAFDFPFVLEGEQYFLSGFPLDDSIFSTLLPDQCIAANAAPGCVGFVTAEGETTTAEFGLAIATLAQPIPEPATLALIASGFLAVSVWRRRRSHELRPEPRRDARAKCGQPFPA